MQTSKPNWSNDSRKQQLLFFQLGLIVAISIVIMAFEWEIPVKFETTSFPPNEYDTIIIYDPLPPPTATATVPPVKKPPVIIKPVPSPEPTPTALEPTVKDEPKDNGNTVHPTIYRMPEETVETTPREYAQIMPEFPGGEQALMKFVNEKILQHSKHCDPYEKVSGKFFICFVVNTKGHVSDIEIVRGLSQCLNDAAIAMAKEMPQWRPGIVNDKFVPVRYKMPVNFTYKLR